MMWQLELRSNPERSPFGDFRVTWPEDKEGLTLAAAAGIEWQAVLRSLGDALRPEEARQSQG